MAKHIEEPVSVEKPSHGGGTKTVTTHPAYAMIGVSRVSGQATLFGSDFEHGATLRITIHTAELNRDLSRDWVHARQQLIQVELSEAQWASFVSSPNIGDGVPCTLLYKGGEDIPALPPPKPRTEQFSAEMRETLQDSIKAIDEAVETLRNAGLPKGKTDALLEKFRMARQELTANVPFVAKSFDKHAEASVEKAKQEIHGYMTGVLMRSGLQALAGETPLMLEPPKDDQ